MRSGQRVEKHRGDGTLTRYVYDLTGQLIAEVSDGQFTEYVYLNRQPLALTATDVAAAAPSLVFIHSDHLGTPQALTDETATVIWEADFTPFGRAEVNEDVDGDANIVTLNLRFPGQYFDTETGLHYNYFRDYDPNW